MDDLDALIIRDLTWKPADPLHHARGPRRPWDTARAAGIHGTTVKRRLAEMRETGVLRGIHLIPAGRLVGRDVGTYMARFSDPAAKNAGVAHLTQDSDVWQAYSFTGDEAIFILTSPHDRDLDARAHDIAMEAGALDVAQRDRLDWDVPLQRVRALDLRILASFAEDALRPIQDVADEIGITRKTVTSRLKALTDMRAFSIIPDVTQADHGMLVYFDARLDETVARQAHAELARRFPHYVCRSVRPAETSFVVETASSAGEIEEKLMQVLSVPGVLSARTLLCKDAVALPHHFRDALLARAHAMLERRIGYPLAAPRVLA